MPDAKSKSSAASLLEHANDEAGQRLEQKGMDKPISMDDMSDEQLKEHLRERGLEVRKARRPKGVVAREDNVRGKLRISVHLPSELRMAVKAASLATNKSESTIGDEAFRLWMNHNNLGT